MFLVGVAATGMFTLSAHFWSYLPLAFLTLVPMGVWLLASGIPEPADHRRGDFSVRLHRPSRTGGASKESPSMPSAFVSI
jgi:hypothetical protein